MKASYLGLSDVTLTHAILMRSVLLCALAIPVSTHAQFTVYTASNSGLSHDGVGSLAESSTGLWVGTLDGLDHFDGSTWTVWTTDNSNIPHDIVTDLAVDTAGYLWSWNYGEGCSRFDGTTFEHFTTTDGLGDNSGSNIMLLNNAIYAGTYGGLSKLDGSEWMNYSTGNSGLPSDMVRDCDADASGGLWVPTIGGGVAYFDGTWTVFNTSNSDLPDNGVQVARVHPNGHVWFGTHNGLVDYASGVFTVYTTSNSILEDNFIEHITFSDDGDVIASGNGGVYIIDPDGDWTSYTSLNSNLPSDEVSETLVDQQGKLWVATTSGLAMFPAWSSTSMESRPVFQQAVVRLSDGTLKVSLPEGSAHVQLVDGLGRTVWTSSGQVARLQQDLGVLLPGVYHVSLWNNHEYRTWKVVAE